MGGKIERKIVQIEKVHNRILIKNNNKLLIEINISHLHKDFCLQIGV